jgi:hypothetical protein
VITDSDSDNGSNEQQEENIKVGLGWMSNNLCGKI